jgi:hypothetical protein
MEPEPTGDPAAVDAPDAERPAPFEPAVELEAEPVEAASEPVEAASEPVEAAPAPAAEPVEAAPEPSAPRPATPGVEDPGRPYVALLAAVAAVVIAVLGVRAAFLGSEASAAWQAAVRQEVKRAAATVEDIRYLYENEALPALQLVRVEILEEEYRRAADATGDGPVKDALEAEAGRYRQLLDLYRAGALIAGDPKYALEGGGYDLVGRLVDLRNRAPDLVSIEPDTLEAAGDAASAKASEYLRAAIPVSLAFVCAALANGFPRRRRPLLGAGVVTMAVGIAAAIAVEAGLL